MKPVEPLNLVHQRLRNFFFHIKKVINKLYFISHFNEEINTVGLWHR